MPRAEQYSPHTNLKWIVLGASVMISAGSIWYTNVLVKQLKDRERQQIELFARALEYTLAGQPDENILFVTEEIILKNNSIPVIWITRDGEYQYRNVDVESNWSEARKRKALDKELERMKALYDPIPITYRNELGETEEYGYVYYRNSFLLTQLTYYPFIQLSVIAIFAFISYLAFNYSRIAEQNQVWVGLAKETAHQLGTPLSSLMAWAEVLREDPGLKNKEIISELEKDIRKLSIVTERFSSIGSVPALKTENIVALVHHVINYFRPRISSRISLEVYSLSDTLMARVNAPLFEWVLENLCKNAVDAIGTSGRIAIKILRGSNRKIYIDISDTGKGIARSNLPLVFKPGFTTKKRGWGLGLALAKRIIENYHNGRIFIKSSEENQGTTFRIELPAEPSGTGQ
ncbi:MAG: two-component sensor histidine kinase [Cyclobacteriaceae bacterium]|nr:MAG: two-component sensor histidine kinase [Cyclobacteriaceae bacterium]